MHLNWLGKTELSGGWWSILFVNYCCKRKMLEETETEKTIGFFVTFLFLMTFQLRKVRAPCPLPPPTYLYVLGSFVLEMRKL